MFLNSDDEDDFAKIPQKQQQQYGRNQPSNQPNLQQQQHQFNSSEYKPSIPSQKHRNFDLKTNAVVTNQKPGSNYTYGQGEDINFDQLATILKSDQKGDVMYEPGMTNTKNKQTGLTPLKSVDQKIKLNENVQKEGHNLLNLENSEDEDFQDVVNKNKQKQPEIAIKQEDMKQKNNNTKKKNPANNLMKELYDDSSDESEDSAKAHNDILQKKEKEKALKSESEEDVDEQADVVDQPIPNQTQNPQATIAQNIQIYDMRQFLCNPVPKGMIIQTTIRRDKSGFARFYPKYHLFLSSDQRYLMTGKKRSNNKTSNYLMSMSKDNLSKKSPDFLGKVRSNFLGTEFHIFDTGENPKKCKTHDKFRKELALIIYESNLLGSRGPRKMKIVIPEVLENGQQTQIKPSNNKDGILQMYKSGKKDMQMHFFNKPPKWNDSVQAFVLNFNGRVDKPSVKNFQLIDEKNDEIIYLQFGRIGEEAFNLDLQYPFSIMQAFGICMSSFDYKIACE